MLRINYLAYLFLICLFLCISCEEETIDPKPPEETTNLYFPPIGSADWETSTAASLGWDDSKIPELLALLENNDTRAFLLLKDGKIVIESYFGRNLLNTADFGANTNWYWASAGKTLTAMTIGIAQEEGLLSLADKSSQYLGTSWTSLSEEQEDKITVWHQLSMTSGLDDGVANNHSLEAADLQYKADPGSRWAYHNAPYTLLDQVVEGASGKDFDDYFAEKISDKIGMDGFWNWLDDNHVYFSTARSMARYGLLILNKGKWGETPVLNDQNFFEEMTTPSQEINKSYGYLWWLNGKSSFMLPQSQTVFSGSIHPAAPEDMISGIGKNGQYVSIVPSQNLVLVRMGGNPEEALVPLLFQEEIWEKLNEIIR